MTHETPNWLPGGDQELLATLLDNHGYAAVLLAMAQYARDCMGEKYGAHPMTPRWNHLHAITANAIEAFVDHLLPGQGA